MEIASAETGLDATSWAPWFGCDAKNAGKLILFLNG